MNKVIELKKSIKGTITVNPELKKYENAVFMPEKLQEAQENIAKYGIPEKVANERAEKGEKHNFWSSGVLIHADAKENAFSLTVKAHNKHSENIYLISTTSETLTTIVKSKWGEMIKVFLRPKAIIGQPFQYDLIEIE